MIILESLTFFRLLLPPTVSSAGCSGLVFLGLCCLEPVCVSDTVLFLIVWNSALARASWPKIWEDNGHRAQNVMLVKQVVIYVVQSQYRNVFEIICYPFRKSVF